MGKQRICELCSNEVVVAYCEADSAFLCLSCDAKVHGANFLVARHIRQIICSKCQDFTGENISGVGSQAKASICPVCSPENLGSGLTYSTRDDSSLSSSSSSACVSSTHSSSSSFCGTTKKKRGGGVKSPPVAAAAVNGGQRVNWEVDSKVVGVFYHWCKRFGLNDEVAHVVVRLACNGMAICASELTILPFRVRLVASLWLGLRFSRIESLSSSQDLTQLEQITGVPAKLISTIESKIERLYRSTKKSQNHNQHDQLLKEGWDESS
ncbi:hypothetical protein LIER_04180 [Lithospermum erythrorhizon]|uniref:B box-type domain-containing protein n=1 Tax=Lithospermum erythrorhizon TaxID=34254 RepID=A0AAV3NVV7_LITER